MPWSAAAAKTAMGDDVTFNIYFTGNTFMGIYDIGAAQSIVDHAKRTLQKIKGYAGSSAGAIVACILLTSPDKVLDLQKAALDLSDKIHGIPQGASSPTYDCITDVKRILESRLVQDAHNVCNGRLFVPITELVPIGDEADWMKKSRVCMEEELSPRLPKQRNDILVLGDQTFRLGETVVVSEFHSRSDLIEVLTASLYQPYCAHWTVPHYKGKMWMDPSPFCKNPEGLQNIPFTQKGRLITIAPNKLGNHLRPSDSFSPGSMEESVGPSPLAQPLKMFKVGSALFPPPRDKMLQAFSNGAEDGKEFLKRWNVFERGIDSYQAQNPYH